MKYFTATILILICVTYGLTQTVDETNGNIYGFNRIQTGSGDWMDVQLVGAGSRFKIHDQTNGQTFVKWNAGAAFTEFMKDIRMSANIRADGGSRNIYGFNRIQTGSGNWLDIQLIGAGSRFKIHDQTNGQTFVKWDAGSAYTNFLKNVVISNGTLGIGTEATGPHKLAVDGSIGAREIKVEMTNWQDQVFYADYELRTLIEVESFITENKHLPEIPSEAEVIENGINLGEMNAKLLQKIEELTLYMIDMNKRMNQLEQENAGLKTSNQELGKKVQLLENQ